MSADMINPVLSPACVLLLAWIFLAAAAHKSRDPDRFAAALRAYRLLPDMLVGPAGRLMAVFELAVAIGLLLPVSRTIAAWAGALLLGIYSLAMAANLIRGRRAIDCGCGGPDGRQSLSEWLLLRNALLMAAAVVAGAPASRVAGWADWVVAVPAAVAIGLIYAACNQLLRNRELLSGLRSSHG
jgi:hypothetical protein